MVVEMVVVMVVEMVVDMVKPWQTTQQCGTC